MKENLISIIMGSHSDWPTLQACGDLLEEFNVPFEARVLSAHRTPDALTQYLHETAQRGTRIFIAAAGGAAHLPGVIASQTLLPVIGVPIATPVMGGVDSLLSIVQMPGGIPVATMAIGKAGAQNAALLAVSMLGMNNEHYQNCIQTYRNARAQKILAKSDLRSAEYVES